MKAVVRARFKEKLDQIDFFSLIEKSARLSTQFFSFSSQNSSSFQNRFVVSFYPFENEPQLNIEKEGGGEPYRVSYIRIEDWNKRLMDAHEARRELPGQWEEFEIAGGTRIFQPLSSQPKCKPTEIAAILVPGIAFTTSGARLGRGAGFYDRYLKAHPEALRIGVALEEQIAQTLPEDSWDEKLDVILTDQSLYTMKTYGEWKKHGKLLVR